MDSGKEKLEFERLPLFVNVNLDEVAVEPTGCRVRDSVPRTMLWSARLVFLLLACTVFGPICYLIKFHLNGPICRLPGASSLSPVTGRVSWSSCGVNIGDDFDCANISVPLDHHNKSDTRRIIVAVTRLKATDAKNR
jgi:hypothetical protein